VLFLLFYLDDDGYALDASKIAEVLPLVSIKKNLRSLPEIAGTFNYRGAFVPVLDLSRLMVGRPAVQRLSTRVILAHCSDESGLLGLIAERATETMRCEPTDFVPSGIVSDAAPYLGSIARGPRGFVQRIELDKLATTPYMISHSSAARRPDDLRRI